jgi:hypothetical protein
MRSLLKISVLALAVVVGACANQKVPAETAVAAAQTAYDSISTDAQKYVPEQAKPIQEALAAARANIDKGDYAAALTAAQALPPQIASLGSAIAAKKEAFTAAWAGVSASVPGMISALTSRVDILGKSRRLPAGITKDALDSAKSGLATATQSWSTAMASAQSGDMATATKQAADVKTTLVQAMKALNMPTPPEM